MLPDYPRSYTRIYVLGMIQYLDCINYLFLKIQYSEDRMGSALDNTEREASIVLGPVGKVILNFWALQFYKI
jgi:hypothetical protein